MNLIMLWYTLSWTKWQQTLPKWHTKCRNNVFKLLLSEAGLLQAHNVAVWLSCYVYIFAILSYLTMVNQCLTFLFFSKNYVSLQRSPLDKAKKNIKPLKI